MKKFKQAFTLAEVLITLVIIGVVAALTIPSLMVKLDKVVKSNQIKVFESKLQQGMDRMNLAGEIGPYYNTTEDFIKALSAHMKIVTICDKDNLTNCFPHEEIQIPDANEPLKLSDIKTGENFGLNTGKETEDYADVAGMVLADGTPMILSWNKNCPVSDPDSSTRAGSKFEEGLNVTNCIAGIYDLNGSKGPNIFNPVKPKDIIGFNVTSLGNTGTKFGGLNLIGGVFVPTPMTIQDICGSSATANTTCTATGEAAALGIKNGYYANDRWAGAVKQCHDAGGRLPSEDEITMLAKYFYNNDNISDIGRTDATLDQTKITGTTFEGLGSSWYVLWSFSEHNSSLAHRRYFDPTYTNRVTSRRDDSGIRAVCVK